MAASPLGRPSIKHMQTCERLCPARRHLWSVQQSLRRTEALPAPSAAENRARSRLAYKRPVPHAVLGHQGDGSAPLQHGPQRTDRLERLAVGAPRLFRAMRLEQGPNGGIGVAHCDLRQGSCQRHRPSRVARRAQHGPTFDQFITTLRVTNEPAADHAVKPRRSAPSFAGRGAAVKRTGRHGMAWHGSVSWRRRLSLTSCPLCPLLMARAHHRLQTVKVEVTRALV